MNEPRPNLVIRVDDTLYGLQVAPKATGETTGAWLGEYKEIEGADSCFDGLANTEAMKAAGSAIATWARGQVIDGHSDWYIPSRDELELLYRHYKPTEEENSRYSGTNSSSVPGGYPYKAKLPAQTTLEDFREGAAEAFDTAWYWSSTQFSRGYAWTQYFTSGNQLTSGKSWEARCRLVRRFRIE